MSETPKFTPGPWYPPHLSDDSTTCNCRSIVEGGYAGGIATVHVHNGIASIRDGGNEAPPLEEAKANGHLIAAAPELYGEGRASARTMEDVADALGERGLLDLADELRARARLVREVLLKAEGLK